ncbi:MAG: zinc ribbon domain-containing protein [Oscillospiraceae bacterium]|nr:zinc ribbon domain-containing protein [Oscillospiraceae bacterium]
MLCSHCGQILEESDLFCPKCGQKIEKLQPAETPFSPVEENPVAAEEEILKGQTEAASPELGQGNQGTVREAPMSAPIPPAYPYYNPVDPAAVPPKKKNKWVIPVVITVAVLVVAIFIVGGILAYTVATNIMQQNVDIDFPSTSQIGTLVNGKELSDYLGGTTDALKNGTGVLLTEYDGTYTNLDSSLMVTVDETSGQIDMLVACDRDVGFTVCGVSIGMSREEALTIAKRYVSDVEDYDDMLAGKNGEEYFAAYFDENGAINYLMYFTYTEDGSSGTNASAGSGIWYIGETLQQAWDFFGTEYELRPQESATVFAYPDEGLYFGTTDTEYTAQSLISYVGMSQDAQFSDEIYIGMGYEEIALFVNLSEIYQDAAGDYQADFSIVLDGRECYGSFSFDGPDSSTANSIDAYMACDDLTQ